MPSKNSINRPKNKNTARAKAQHKSAVARRTQQTDIVYGKVDSKKVAQKKLRRARLAEAHAATLALEEAKGASSPQQGDVEMREEDEGIAGEDADEDAAEAKKLAKLDTRAKKEARRAKLAKDKEVVAASAAAPEVRMDTTTGRGTTLGGPIGI